MATSLAAMTARRAAALTRLSPSATRAASRRGLSGAAESHAPPKGSVSHEDDYPMWKESLPTVAVMSSTFGFLTGVRIMYDGEEKVAEPAK